MTIDKLKPGMTVYDVQRQRMGNTTISTIAVYHVYIKEVDADGGMVFASWNGNTPEWEHRRTWSKWRLNEPLTIRSAFGSRRLATRAEIKAAKEAKGQ